MRPAFDDDAEAVGLDEHRAAERREVLDRYCLLDGAAAVGLDRAARLAQFIAGSRFAAVHLLDDRSQHRVASVGGAPLGATDVADSMCVRVVESGAQVYSSDATLDERLQGTPFTSGPDPVRFYCAAPLRAATGLIIGTLCVYDHVRLEVDEDRLRLLQDVAAQVAEHLELHRSSRDLAHAAMHDPLTGLPNRTLLSDRLAHAMTRRRRQPEALALAMIDLDGFKDVNDRFGHQAGDEVLREVGRRLLAEARAEDTVARLGGDEFIVLFGRLPDQPSSQSLDVMRERLERVFDEPFTVEGEKLMIKASVGLVAAGPEERGYELLGRADDLMYQRKPERKDGPAGGWRRTPRDTSPGSNEIS